MTTMVAFSTGIRDAEVITPFDLSKTSVVAPANWLELDAAAMGEIRTVPPVANGDAAALFVDHKR